MGNLIVSKTLTSHGISNKVPHTYIADGIRYFAFLRDAEYRSEDSDAVTKFVNFYIFDADGYCWFQICHATLSFLRHLLTTLGILGTRTILTADDTTSTRKPLFESDTWIQGHADRGYALETIRGALGLNLTYLNEVFEELETQSNEMDTISD